MTTNNKYLFYVTLSYSFSVLRPIEQELQKRGHQVAWFIPDGAEAEGFIDAADNRLLDMKAVKQYNSDAVLAPGNYIPDFFPGVKVQVFHGFDSGKKNKFNIRGFFDLYCTQGPNITEAFNAINDGTCEVVETGWAKLDPLFTEHADTQSYRTDKPLIFYGPTFSPKLTSTYDLYEQIKRLSVNKEWHWIVKLHPKATAEEIAMFKALESDRLRFLETGNLIPLLQASDVLLSDTSSILAEFALQNKPVVAYKNRRPESWMINFSEAEQLEQQLSYALSAEQKLLQNIEQHCDAIHPYRDGQSSERVVNAIDDLIARGTGHLKSKPLNLVRRLKMRKKLKYYRWK
ncbi:CDP-glycerol glycerophosphotransferase family protein [Thalassotalea sp. Y01]|uniref:CDP-glycerol glycerophosphotransferase family protein n=1 Tax=Thalassotalea sp. Y01 TaxID=2729613 RepID=UPI00145C8280|nr:CDP-glycerol glycerophosphotransferase family protein [Thalassotalea sp. Y01]NMP15143.1 CDP-glycerol:glycerophosphate glycerophosphotransferase [Thalassotalea sp. Y01]